MTIDDAIKYCLEVAEAQEEVIKSRKIYVEVKGLTPLDECRKIAADHKQLAEWLEELRARRLLMDKVCGELAELYGSPCQNPKAENFIRENGTCNDCKISITDKECWFRYFHRKFNC